MNTLLKSLVAATVLATGLAALAPVEAHAYTVYRGGPGYVRHGYSHAGYGNHHGYARGSYGHRYGGGYSHGYHGRSGYHGGSYGHGGGHHGPRTYAR